VKRELVSSWFFDLTKCPAWRGPAYSLHRGRSNWHSMLRATMAIAFDRPADVAQLVERISRKRSL
jgi:hypothetical protein